MSDRAFGMIFMIFAVVFVVAGLMFLYLALFYEPVGVIPRAIFLIEAGGMAWVSRFAYNLARSAFHNGRSSS